MASASARGYMRMIAGTCVVLTTRMPFTGSIDTPPQLVAPMKLGNITLPRVEGGVNTPPQSAASNFSRHLPLSQGVKPQMSSRVSSRRTMKAGFTGKGWVGL